MHSAVMQMSEGQFPAVVVPERRASAPHFSLGFAVFLLVNAALFIRPSDLIASLREVPLYEILAVSCLIVSLGAVLTQLNSRRLAARPITVCVLGMIPAAYLSHASHFAFGAATKYAIEACKLAIYYLLLVGVVGTPLRLRRFALCLTLFIAVLSLLPVLQHHHYIDNPALTPIEDTGSDKESGKEIKFERIRAAGIFNDPNDLCHILGTGVMLSLYWLKVHRSVVLRVFWLGVLGLFAYTVTLTQSRGGLLSLMSGVGVLAICRFGWRKAIVIGALGLPLLLLAGGRQTSISTKEETGQERIQRWGDALAEFRHNPLLGMGEGKFGAGEELVAHNSFMQCYTELGFLGGSLFLGAFGLSLWMLLRLGAFESRIIDPHLRQLRPFLAAVVVAYIGGMFSLSRCYVVPTYVILGLACAYTQVVETVPPVSPLRFNKRLVNRLAMASLLFLVGIHVFVRFFGHW